MSKHKQRNRATNIDPSIPQARDLTKEPAKRPRRRWLRWGLFLVLGLLLCILLAPTILSKTLARDYLLSKVIPKDAGSLTIESMSLGWFSPLSISGVRFSDPSGAPLMVAEKIAGERSLLALAQNPTNLGSIVITRPSVQLLLRHDGSNLEDVIAKLAPSTVDAEQSPSSTPVGLSAQIQLVDAEIIATEIATQSTWKLQQLNVEANLPAATDADWRVTANGVLDGQPFAVDVATPMGLATADWPLGPTGKVTVQTQALPLAPLRYAAVRSGQPIEQLQGSFTSNLVANWQHDNAGSSIPKLNAVGLLRTDDLLVAAKAFFGPDVLRLASAQLDTKIQIANNVAILEQGDLNSDYGKASLVTTIKLDRWQDANAIVEAIRQQKLNTSGEIDLAALARALPNTFKIRDDVQMASGRLAWSVQSTVSPGAATRWTGGLQTSDVKVLRGGQPIDWQFPLEVSFSAVDGDEMLLENVIARSDFFSLAGQGKLREGKLQARADLERLVYQLSQVMDLGNLYVRGQMQSLVQWSELQPNQLKLDGRTKLSNFAMTQNEQLLCQEAELNATTQATATLSGQQVASLDSARVDIISGDDFMVAELQQPVVNPGTDSNWNLACRLKGELTSWVGRLKTMGAGLEWQVAGQVDTTTQITANGQHVAVHSFSVDVRNLQAATEGMVVREPVVQIQTAGSVDLTTLACRFPETKVTSQTVSLTAHALSVDMQPHFIVTGKVGYRTDLGRLMAVLPSESGQQITGQAVGRLDLEAKEQLTSFNLDGWVENLTVLEATGAPLWQEPKLTMQMSGAYDGAQDSLDLQQAQIAGRVVNLVATGRASSLTTDVNIDLSGEYGYDLTGLVAIFRDMIGPSIELTGAQRQKFAVKGPVFPAPPAAGLVSNELVAQAGLGWNSANVYGISLGQGQVDAALANGVLQISPLELAVGQGQVRLAPTLHLNTEAMWMTLPPGPVVQNVRLDPQMTGGWMKYITPMMADATSAEGTFSIALSRTEVPLMDPMKGRVQGLFEIHGGALGPGPMASQLLELATQIKRLTGKGDSRIVDPSKSWVQLQPQQIEFEMSDGRVYHKGFEMTVDGVPIRTSGSVGVEDQTLAVMAEVPILDEWLDGSPHLAGLRGQVVSVPIRGTTSRPELDRQALTQATMQLARQGVSGYLQGQLNEKLGGKLQNALGGNLNDILGSGDAAANPQQPQQPQQDLGTQLQNKAQEEIGRQLNKLFK